MHNPKFNFTEGGDGFGSGENNPNYGKCGEECPHYKNYARVIKGGLKESKQTYSLEYKSTTLTTSINKEELQKLANKINAGEDPEVLLKKPLAVINKEGIKSGTQYYSIIYNKYLLCNDWPIYEAKAWQSNKSLPCGIISSAVIRLSDHYIDNTLNSTRRLLARPSSVSFVSMGNDLP